MMDGLVIKSTGNEISVKLSNGEKRMCKIRGRFRIQSIKSTNPVAVGDHVVVEVNENDAYGWITDIKDRTNFIVRKSINLSHQAHIIAANIDHAFLITTLQNPFTTLGFIDRFLVTCEAYHIPASIVVNKCDEWAEKEEIEFEYRKQIYEAAGYPTLATSVISKAGLTELKNRMHGNISLFSGHSGVGKSSLINVMYPEFNLKTGAVSEVHRKGTHTTTFAELFELAENTFIIDSPGIKELGLYKMQKHEIGSYFPEIRELSDQCRFNNCLHLNEPDCAVRKAAEEELLSSERFSSYLNMLNSDELIALPGQNKR